MRVRVCVCTHVSSRHTCSEQVLSKESLTRHRNFHGKFSLCAEYLIRLIGQKLTCMLKVFTDYSEVFI